MGLGRLLTGMAFLIFAISLLPGMFGGRLGDLDAYVPAASGCSSAEAPAGGGGLVWMKNQYREALDRRAREGKLVFVNFTGYACANCHWMKANMFTRPEIAAAMQELRAGGIYTRRHGRGLRREPEAGAGEVPDRGGAVLRHHGSRRKRDRDVPGAHAKIRRSFWLPRKRAEAARPASRPKRTFPQVNGLDGAPIDAAGLNGKVVVVNFWATWCVPCIQEIPSFNKLHQEYAGKGVAVVGVSMDDEGAERVRPFLKKHPMDYTVALGSDAVTKEFGLDELPVTVVFDRSGKQIKRFAGFLKEDELKAAVAQAL